MQIRIYYEDTDAGGVVYHTNYLKFCERARSELFFSNGFSPAIDGGHFVVKHIEADFLMVAKLGDIIEMYHEIVELGGASLKLKQEIFRNNEKLFSMIGTLVFVREGKPTRFSPETKKIIKKIFDNN